MTRNINHGKPITEGFHTMCTDWQRCIIQQLFIISISTEELICTMKKLLAVLLPGNAAIHFRSTVHEYSQIVEDVFSEISSALNEPLLSHLSIIQIFRVEALPV